MRALGAFYMRLIATSTELYKYLEPLYVDYRKMKRMTKDAKFQLIHVDEFIDELLHGERVCDITLPRIQKRYVLEELNELEARVSALDVDFMDEVESSEDEASEAASSDSDQSDKERDARKSREDSRERKSRQEAERGWCLKLALGFKKKFSF